MRKIKKYNKYALLFGALCVPTVFLFFNNQKKTETIQDHRKKKILIFTSPGGGGHLSASKALTHYLSPNYDVKVEYILENVLKDIDPVQKCTFGGLSCEGLYNKLLHSQMFSFINFFYRLGPWFFKLNEETGNQHILNYLAQEKPDLVVSVTPIFNYMLLRATRKLSIPLLVSATDMDLTAFLENLEVTPLDQFYLNLVYDDKKMKKKALDIGVKPSHLSAYGIPLRPSFFKEYDSKQFKQQFDIPENKPIALVTLGSQVSKQTRLIAQQLKKIKYPLHIIFCTSRNETLKKQIKKIKYPRHVSTTVLGFTDQIASLMANSDFLISKGGGVTVFEALHSSIPLLLDKTSATLKWEQYTYSFIHQNHCGTSFAAMRSLAPMINELLECPKKLESYRYGLSSIKTENAGEKILKLVNKILSPEDA